MAMQTKYLSTLSSPIMLMSVDFLIASICYLGVLFDLSLDGGKGWMTFFLIASSTIQYATKAKVASVLCWSYASKSLIGVPELVLVKI